MGSFATHAVVHYSKAVAVPDNVGLDVACLVGCGVPTGVGSAVNTAQVRRGSTCVVYGCGGVGLNVIQGCRLMGAAEIVAVDLLVDKLALTEKFGATGTVYPVWRIIAGKSITAELVSNYPVWRIIAGKSITAELVSNDKASA